MTPYIIEKCRM